MTENKIYNDIRAYSVSLDEFEKYEKKFDTANFIQTAAYGRMKQSTLGKNNVDSILFKDAKDQVVGSCIILYQKKRKIFKEALVLSGPLLNNDSPYSKSILQSLRDYATSQKVDILTLTPYIPYKIRNDQLEITYINSHDDFIKNTKELGYSHILLEEEIYYTPNQIYRKNLQNIGTEVELFETFAPMTQRNIIKCQKEGVKTKTITEDELPLFYSLISETAKRKGFFIQDYNFFHEIYKNFKNDVQVTLAYLDFHEYIDVQQKHIDKFNKQISKIDEKKSTPKLEKKKANLIQERQIYLDKVAAIEKVNVDNKEQIPLSSIICIDTDIERVYFMGGSYPETVKFGASAYLLSESVLDAYKNGKKYFNFYGTIEVELAANKTGNLYFKQQFNGELVNNIGRFEYLSWKAKLAKIFKK